MRRKEVRLINRGVTKNRHSLHICKQVVCVCVFVEGRGQLITLPPMSLLKLIV